MVRYKTHYFIGTAGWNYPDWRGIFYPKHLPQKKWLAFYQDNFSIVEINATFYRFFKKEIFIKWRLAAEKNFKYIIKVNRNITHIKRLKNCKRLIKQFCQDVALLEDKLALILLQLPPSMPYDINRLKIALLQFDDPTKLVVEFRHKKWLTEETKNLLTSIGCTFCIADSPATKMVSWVTSQKAYIRLHGRTKWFNYKYSYLQLKNIINFAKHLPEQGAKKVYILLNNDYYAYAVQNARYLQKFLK